MIFVFLLAVVVTVVISENSPHTPAVPALWFFAIALLSQMACLAALVANGRRSQVLLQDKTLSERELSDVLSKNIAVNQVVWFLGIAGTLLLGKWTQLVRYNGGLASAVLIDELLILLPVVVPAIVLWSVNYDLEMTSAARENRYVRAPSRRFHFIWTHAQFYLGLLTLPLLVVVGGHDALQRWGSDDLRSALGSFAWFPMLGGAVLALPFLLRHLWKTTPLIDSPLRSRLLGDCHEIGLQVRDILIWYTSGFAVNAAVLGLTPWSRYVLLTDGLVARLDDAEISAVFRHEAGHIQRRHLPIRLLIVGLPLFGLYVFQSFALGGTAELASDGGIEQSLAPQLLFTASLFAYLTLSLGWIARLQEHDADLWAARLYTANSQAASEGAERLTRALEKLAGNDEHSRRQRDWLHPSVQSRVDLLRRAVEKPGEAARFRRSLHIASTVIVAAYVGLGLFWFAL